MRPSLLTLLFVPLSFAVGSETNSRGTRSTSLANAFIAVSDDPWLVCHNPAGLASLSAFKTSLSLIPQPYGLKELRSAALVAGLPTTVSSVGLMLDDFGTSMYREMNLVLAAGRTIADGVALGISLNLGLVSIERYGSSGSASIDLGVSWQVMESFRLAYAWGNVTGAHLGRTNDPLPQSHTMGFCFCPHRSVQLTLDLEKEIRVPFTLRAGIELQVLEYLSIRCGSASEPEILAAGLEVRLSRWECSYALQSHPLLGITHAIGLSYELPR